MDKHYAIFYFFLLATIKSSMQEMMKYQAMITQKLSSNPSHTIISTSNIMNK